MSKTIDNFYLRQQMVEVQLVGRKISDARVISAFRKVKRHEFVLPQDKDIAYQDSPLPIGDGQTISQPYMAALMTECLNLKGSEKVLEIGTGCGYQTAILAELAKNVYSIERIEALTKKADAVLKNLGYNNVVLETGDGARGYLKHAPYDSIIVTAACRKIPDVYLEQLKVGGKIVIPLGDRFSQVLTVAKKTDTGIDKHVVCGCVFVPLIGKDGWDK